MRNGWYTLFEYVFNFSTSYTADDVFMCIKLACDVAFVHVLSYTYNTSQDRRCLAMILEFVVCAKLWYQARGLIQYDWYSAAVVFENPNLLDVAVESSDGLQG